MVKTDPEAKPLNEIRDAMKAYTTRLPMDENQSLSGKDHDATTITMRLPFCLIVSLLAGTVPNLRALCCDQAIKISSNTNVHDFLSYVLIFNKFFSCF